MAGWGMVGKLFDFCVIEDAIILMNEIEFKVAVDLVIPSKLMPIFSLFFLFQYVDFKGHWLLDGEILGDVLFVAYFLLVWEHWEVNVVENSSDYHFTGGFVIIFRVL